MNNRDYTWLTTLLTAARGIFCALGYLSQKDSSLNFKFPTDVNA